jgi:hypothetical protein
MPEREECPCQDMAKSGIAVLPRITAPAFRSRVTRCASVEGT